MIPAFPFLGPALFRSLAPTLAGLFFFALGTTARAQIWINPGGVGGPPPDQVTYATNRLDLDLDGAADFEIVTQVNTTYVAEIRGWAPRRTTTISLVPLGGARILASDLNDHFSGDVPVLAENEVVGPAKAGWHWSGRAHNLVVRSEPSFLFGPLAPASIGAPGKFHLGVSLGTPEAPIYAWLCFQGGVIPIYWGYARQPSVAVAAGDRSSAPPLRMKVKLENGHLPDLKWSVISWEPAFAEATVEERVGLAGAWIPLVDPTIEVNRHVSVPVNAATPAGEVRMYRVRFGP